MKHKVSIVKTKHGDRYLLRGVKVHKKGGQGYKSGKGNKFISKAKYNQLKKEGVIHVKTRKATGKHWKSIIKGKRKAPRKKTKKGKRKHISKSKMNTIIKCCKDILKKSH